MFTICPKCALTLVVTAADLRVAQGHVRCGRCSSVFNALARLTEERQAASPDSSPPPPLPPLPPGPSLVDTPGTTSTPAQPGDEPGQSAPAEEAALPGEAAAAADLDVIPEEALEFNPATTDAESVFVQAQPDPQWEAATGSFKAMVAANQDPLLAPESEGLVEVEIDSGFLSEIIRADAHGTPQVPASPLAAAPAPLPAPAPASPPEQASPSAAANSAPPGMKATRHAARHPRPASAADAHMRPGVERTPPGPEAAAPAAPAPAPAAAAAYGRERLAADADEEEDDEKLTPSPPYAWIFGIAAAALALIAQIVNHNRETLAASARFNRPLTAVYASLGMTLKPRWDLHAYDVRQLGASVDPANAGEITVRASIKNAGPQPQPLPLLRVTLQDRFGNRIAARDVPPQFYVPGAVPAAALLGAGQRIDAEMAFLDPGASAVGFELDACLPASGGGVACANDAGAR